MTQPAGDRMDNKIPTPVASYVSQAEKRLSELTKRQFSFMIVATLLPAIVLAIVLGIVPIFMRTPTSTEMIDLLSDSNQQLSDLTQVLLQSSLPITTTTRALEVVLLQPITRMFVSPAACAFAYVTVTVDWSVCGVAARTWTNASGAGAATTL